MSPGEKEGNFTQSKKNPSVLGKLKHPTDLLAWVFIVSFYSEELIILVHLFNLLIVIALSCGARIVNKT